MQDKTNVMRILDSKKIWYKSYYYKDTSAISGMEVVNVLNEDPNKVFKTLVTRAGSGIYYVFVVPVNKELNLKKAARSVREKNVEMIKQKELLPITGYIHGGCSPIGMKKSFKTIIDISAKEYNTMFVSGGKVGYQIEVGVIDLADIIRAEFYDIVK